MPHVDEPELAVEGADAGRSRTGVRAKSAVAARARGLLDQALDATEATADSGIRLHLDRFLAERDDGAALRLWLGIPPARRFNLTREELLQRLSSDIATLDDLFATTVSDIDPTMGAITLRQLLSHTGGIDDTVLAPSLALISDAPPLSEQRVEGARTMITHPPTADVGRHLY